MLTEPEGSTLAVKDGTIFQYLMAPNQKIFWGSLVALRADGLMYSAVEDVTDTYQQVVRGFAMESKDTTDGSTTTNIRCRRDMRKSLNFQNIFNQNIVGKLGCLKDNNTVQLYDVAECKVVVGRITAQDGVNVYVDLSDQPSRIATSASN